MSRFIIDLNTGKPDDFVRFVAEDFFAKEGFLLTNYKGEMVWKKGNGLLTVPQFIKLSSVGGQVHLEAWIAKLALLPGVYVGESGVTGFWGWAVKAALKKRVDTLMALLYQNVPTFQTAGPPAAQVPAAAPAAGMPVSAGEGPGAVPVPPAQEATMPPVGYPQQAPAPQGVPIPVAVHNPTGKATLSLVMGLVSVSGCFLSLIGVVTAVIGILSGITGRKSTARGMATAGLALSIVFLVFSLINFAAGVLYNFV